MEKWLSSKEFRKKYDISSATLWRRVHVGSVKTKLIFNTTYYLDESYNDDKIDNKLNIIYCRVSNTKLKDDLIRQEQLLKEFCVKNGIIPDLVISDIASGMNENRKGLNELLEMIKEYKVNKVYISYKDRLTRFGYGYFEHLFKLFNTEIVVVNLTAEEDFLLELTQDFISILHHFSMKLYSNRRKELKELKKSLENEFLSKNS